MLPFQAHANFKLSPRVISLLQNQVRTKVSQAYAKTLSKLLILPASPAYNEVIRRISFPERINIVDQMQNLSSRVQTRFIKSVTSGNWEEIQAISNYPSHALKALRENAISPEDFASVMFP